MPTVSEALRTQSSHGPRVRFRIADQSLEILSNWATAFWKHTCIHLQNTAIIMAKFSNSTGRNHVGLPGHIRKTNLDLVNGQPAEPTALTAPFYSERHFLGEK